MKTPIHRVTADSKAGRKLAARKSRIEPGVGLTKEQREWNANLAKQKCKHHNTKQGGAEVYCDDCGLVLHA